MLAIVVALFGQSKAESRQDRRPHIIELPNKVSHVQQQQQQHMSVQATEMSAIKFVRSVRILALSPKL